MSDILPAAPLFGAFAIASVVLAVTPGPGVLYIVARTLAQGRLAGLASVAGVALGNLGNAIGAALGLAALFAVSSLAFTVTKYLGACYLVYLGVEMLRARPIAVPVERDTPVTTAWRPIFRDGFVVALLNPKTAIFFAAFLPQFIDQPQAPLPQTLLLGGVFVAIAAFTDSVYALLAGSLQRFLRRDGRVAASGRYVGGSAFIGLGLFAALTLEKPVR